MLFALHPINVDSVAWISARSNLLFTAFFLLSIISYNAFIMSQHKNRFLYLFFSWLSFILSVLSKTAGVMLPFVLMAIDFYRNNKFNRKLLWLKLPYFIIGLTAGIITLYFRGDVENTQTPFEYSFLHRIMILCYSVFSYFYRVLLPIDLSEIYAYPDISNDSLPLIYYFSPFIVIIMVWGLIKIKPCRKELLLGLFFFLINLLITQIAYLEDGFMANRYAYLPFVGLFFYMACIISHYLSVMPVKKFLFIGITALLVFFTLASYKRSMIWKDSQHLFNHMVKSSPNSGFAFNLRATLEFNKGNFKAALNDYNKAIKINEKYYIAYKNRGITHQALGNFVQAMNDFNPAIELNQGCSECYLGRGIIFMDVIKNPEQAKFNYDMALKYNPFNARAYYNRGILEMRMGAVDMACLDFKMVKKLGYSKADTFINDYCN